MIDVPHPRVAPHEADVAHVGRPDTVAGGGPHLNKAWDPPTGWRIFTEINNTRIGLWYVATAFVFLILGGILAILIRIQLARPEAALLSPEAYNQIFTMHGTTMMFLFAVPMVEAVAVILMPNQLAARDLPFPRASAFGFWCYLFGGTMTYGSLFWGVAPDGGWFMYPPLTSAGYSPGLGADFWLLGLGFVEVSAIAAALELIVRFFKTRAPGMSIDKVPIFSWYMLVVAFMIVFGFPPLIVGDILLELERAFDWPFFLPERGGDPILWQHLFWLFGHPEVYIIFLPAAGILSTIIPTMVGRPLFGYGFIVLAAVATGFLSFGLWVHHMYATGLPQLSLAFFSAASLAVAIPSGIQVFAWIATIWDGKPQWHSPFLFCLGAIVTFVIGGLTGVMVAIAPYDWQVHDTYFIVAHLHYVLIGGMVFPVLAAFVYWFPYVRARMMSERLAKASFWLIFAGFHVAFFPMHLMGLLGMPRRVYTYPEAMGWGTLNMLSTVGSLVLTLGFVLFTINLVHSWFRGRPAQRNPWNAGTMEWATDLPSPSFGLASVPWIRSHYPLWDQPGIVKDIDDGLFFLPGAAAARRETLRTSTVDAEPRQIVWVPHPTIVPFLAAVVTATMFFLMIFKLWTPVAILAALDLALILIWVWDTEWRPHPNVIDAGVGWRLPIYATGPDTIAWWGMSVLLFADGAAFTSILFAYLFLWTVNPDWPVAVLAEASLTGPAVAAALVALSAAAMVAADAFLLRRRTGAAALAIVAATATMAAWPFVEIAALRDVGLDPTSSSFAAASAVTVAWCVVHAAIACVMGGFLLMRLAVGRLDAFYRLSLDVVSMFWWYTAAQVLLGLAVVHLFVRAL